MQKIQIFYLCEHDGSLVSMPDHVFDKKKTHVVPVYQNKNTVYDQ